MKKLIILLMAYCQIMAASPSNQTIRIQHFGEDEGFSAAVVQHMIQDSRGYIWLATWDGLRRYDGYRFETFKAIPGDQCPLETNRFVYIEEDHDGNIICMSNDKPYLFNTKSRKFEPYRGKEVKARAYHAPKQVSDLIRNITGFEEIEIHIMLLDRQQGVWTYSHRGLERISLVAKPVKTEQTNGQNEQVVSALLTDRHGQLWTADKQGYICINDNKGTIRWLALDGRLQAQRICFGYAAYYIYEDHQGTIWIGAKPGGLFRLKSEGGHYLISHFTPDKNDIYSLNNDCVYAIHEENSGHRILIATYGGGLNIGEPQSDGTMRFVHCGNRLKQYPKTGLKSRCVFIRPDGTTLLGTNDGLYAFSLREPYEKMHFYVNRRQPNQIQSISNNYVLEILQTKKGDIYVATSGGGTEKIVSTQLLSDTIHFKHHSVREGISSDMNETLAEDADGNVWIVSAGSVSLLNTQTGVATNYWHLLKQTSNVFTEATPTMLPDSGMVLGTTNGILTLRPNQMKKSAFIPPIVFDCEKEVRLSSDERDFTVHFSALDYNKNEEIMYAYRLKKTGEPDGTSGVDSLWRYTRQNELNYVSLAPGTYTLHIKSTNGDGVWTDNEATITLYRAASFHETPWAWMLYGGLFVLLVAAVVGTFRYIQTLKRELKDVRLTSMEQIELLGSRLKEMLPIAESVKEIHEESDEQLSDDDRLFAVKLKKYVEENIGNPNLSVQNMASEMNVSRTVLFVRMKHIFDSSPNNYVLNTRINYAKHLLMESGARVSDVAYRCGFSDPKYFSRCFKKLTGCLPKDYTGDS